MPKILQKTYIQTQRVTTKYRADTTLQHLLTIHHILGTSSLQFTLTKLTLSATVYGVLTLTHNHWISLEGAVSYRR